VCRCVYVCRVCVCVCVCVCVYERAYTITFCTVGCASCRLENSRAQLAEITSVP